MRIPLFDLDGTLLFGGRGNKPHRDSFDFALKTIYDLPHASIDNIVADGMVDTQILVTIAVIHGYTQADAIAKLPQAIPAMVNYFLLHKDNNPATAHEGALELLRTLQQNKMHRGVLTGNVEAIGWGKLAQAGLDEFIEFGSFGNMALNRVDLIEIAQKKYEAKFGEYRSVTDFVIIGDTPKDIFCAKDGGIQVIAVSTGNYTKEELQQENPDLVIESLEEKEKILKFLNNS